MEGGLGQGMPARLRDIQGTPAFPKEPGHSRTPPAVQQGTRSPFVAVGSPVQLRLGDVARPDPRAFPVGTQVTSVRGSGAEDIGTAVSLVPGVQECQDGTRDSKEQETEQQIGEGRVAHRAPLSLGGGRARDTQVPRERAPAFQPPLPKDQAAACVLRRGCGAKHREFVHQRPDSRTSWKWWPGPGESLSEEPSLSLTSHGSAAFCCLC